MTFERSWTLDQLDLCTVDGCTEQPTPHLDHFRSIGIAAVWTRHLAKGVYAAERDAVEWVDIGGEA